MEELPKLNNEKSIKETSQNQCNWVQSVTWVAVDPSDANITNYPHICMS